MCCTLHPAGQYQSLEGQTKCRVCPFGTYSAVSGSTECAGVLPSELRFSSEPSDNPGRSAVVTLYASASATTAVELGRSFQPGLLTADQCIDVTVKDKLGGYASPADQPFRGLVFDLGESKSLSRLVLYLDHDTDQDFRIWASDSSTPINQGTAGYSPCRVADNSPYLASGTQPSDASQAHFLSGADLGDFENHKIVDARCLTAIAGRYVFLDARFADNAPRA